MESRTGSARPDEPVSAPDLGQAPTFDELYTQHFAFVWRNLRRLGVPAALVEDATQDTFVVVHRRLADLQQGASPKGWLFGIARRVASDYRRARQRKPTVSADHDQTIATDHGPAEHAERSQAARVLDRFLASLDEERRHVFVLAQLEQLSAPEISETLGVAVNTVYSRLRSARERFVDFLDAEGLASG
jgi:RNA polymerase sigma-70 factor (ECF subfamily)